MNRKEILQSCQAELARKRATAQNLSYQNLVKARNIDEFIKLERRERAITFEIGKNKAYGFPTEELENNLAGIKEQKHNILSKIGLSESDLSPKYSCKQCNDLGYTTTGMCNCLKNLLNSKLLEECGAGKNRLADFKDFDESIIKTPEQKQQLIKLKQIFEKIACAYPSCSHKFFILSGKTGVGKTFLTECLAKALIERGFLVSFISSFGMNNMFLSYHTCNNDQKQSYLNSLIDPDVLVIDDLGTEPMLRNVTKEYLYVVVSERSRLNKLTVVTTNLDPQNIIDRYDERIFSRLCNKRESVLINITGKDLRLEKK